MKQPLYKRFNVLTILAVLIIGFILVQITPVTVLEDWHTNTDKQSYSVGDTVKLKSSFNKKFNADPDSARFIECEYMGGVRDYPLFFTFATHSKGKTTAYTDIVIVPIDQPKPATCRLLVKVDYNLYGIKPVHQQVLSNPFVIN